MKNLKDYERMAIALAFMNLIILAMVLWNSYDIKKIDNRNKKLNERITQLEVDYKIYEMNLSEIQENN